MFTLSLIVNGGILLENDQLINRVKFVVNVMDY